MTKRKKRDLLKRRIFEKGYNSQRDFAFAIKEDEGLISNIISGFRDPSENLLEKFKKYLGDDVIELL